MRTKLVIAAAALVLAVAACGDDDGGERHFDDSGMDQHGCQADEEYQDGLCLPGPCLEDAQWRMDEAPADDVDTYNEAVDDANACEAEAREQIEETGTTAADPEDYG